MTGKLTEGLCLLGLSLATDWRTAVILITVGVTIGGLAEAGISTMCLWHTYLFHQPRRGNPYRENIGALCVLKSGYHMSSVTTSDISKTFFALTRALIHRPTFVVSIWLVARACLSTTARLWSPRLPIVTSWSTQGN